MTLEKGKHKNGKRGVKIFSPLGGFNFALSYTDAKQTQGHNKMVKLTQENEMKGKKMVLVIRKAKGTVKK